MKLESFLNHTCAGSLMTRSLVALLPDMSLAEAAGVLLDHQVSGAPVVDLHGICVGVLSAADFVKAEQHVASEQEKVLESTFWKSNLLLPESINAEKLAAVREKLVPAAEQKVSEVMTRDLVSVSESTPARKVIEYMVDAHIHRVFVLDSDDKLVGIITTIDILAAFLRAGHPS